MLFENSEYACRELNVRVSLINLCTYNTLGCENMIVQMSGGQILELSDERSPVGHLIMNIGKLFGYHSPDEAYEVYMETPKPGAKPVMAYVPLLEDGTPDFQQTTQLPLEKAHVQKVST